MKFGFRMFCHISDIPVHSVAFSSVFLQRCASYVPFANPASLKNLI